MYGHFIVILWSCYGTDLDFTTVRINSLINCLTSKHDHMQRQSKVHLLVLCLSLVQWTVNGKLRIGFFSVKPMATGDELTFDYKFQRFG